MMLDWMMDKETDEDIKKLRKRQTEKVRRPGQVYRSLWRHAKTD